MLTGVALTLVIIIMAWLWSMRGMPVEILAKRTALIAGIIRRANNFLLRAAAQ
jgi:hypothetical protein